MCGSEEISMERKGGGKDGVRVLVGVKPSMERKGIGRC